MQVLLDLWAPVCQFEELKYVEGCTDHGFSKEKYVPELSSAKNDVAGIIADRWRYLPIGTTEVQRPLGEGQAGDDRKPDQETWRVG